MREAEKKKVQFFTPVQFDSGLNMYQSTVWDARRGSWRSVLRIPLRVFWSCSLLAPRPASNPT